MILFKAINYKENFPQKMTSKFEGKYIEDSCFEDIITTAFRHVSHGDRSKEKDYWISTTKSFSKAIELMNSDKYNYNGIAILELSETEHTGFIYDECLREKGYIAKEIRDNEAKQKWKVNNDGIVLSLDMSSEFTINYLASYLWLKGNKKSLGNIRTYRYAKSHDEVLILGENISFEFISKETIQDNYDSFNDIIRQENIIRDYNTLLYKKFIELAPESSKKKQIKILNNISDGETYEYYSDNELDYVRRKEISSFYENAKFTFNKRIAKKIFNDEQCTELDINEFVKPYDDREISFEYYLWAYICSGVYINLKSNEERRFIWKIINELYEGEVICGKVRIFIKR